MKWTDELKLELAKAWQDRDEEEAGAFDKRLAAELGFSVRAVQSKRARLGLVESDEDGDSFEDDLEEMLEKERKFQKQNAHKRALRGLLKEKIKDEVVGEAFLKAVKSIAPPKRESLKTSRNDQDEEMVVLISDAQIGSCCKQDYMRGVSKFNSNIFLERAAVFTRAVRKLLSDRQKVTSVATLRVLMLGDIIDGDAIFQSQPYELDQTVVDQVMTGFQTFATAISSWSALVPEVKVHCIVGNHGRVRHGGSVRDNWEYLLYKMMELQLKEHDNITFDIQRSPFHVVEIRGWRFLCTHGDELRGRNPTVPATRMEGDWRSLLKEHFDYYVFGHHHRAVQFEVSGGEILCNGAFPGGSSYSIGKLVLSSRPSQLVFGVTREEGISWRWKVDLDRFPV